MFSWFAGGGGEVNGGGGDRDNSGVNQSGAPIPEISKVVMVVSRVDDAVQVLG